MHRLAILFAAVVFSAAGFAQLSEKAEEKPRETEKPAVSEKKKTSQKSKASEVQDVFIPSEEVSEDSSVSFPADI